jgi:hypothetical protein
LSVTERLVRLAVRLLGRDIVVVQIEAVDVVGSRLSWRLDRQMFASAGLNSSR